MSETLKETVHSKHPVLKSAANYFFNISGKKMRPLIILLLSHCICLNRGEEIAKKHQKLSEIAEMIHVASLIHDDIIDDSPMRRGIPTLHQKFGNKIAVLSGDFLLSRASVSLTKLGNIEVIRLLSTVIEHLAHGEIWQIAGIGTASFEEYLNKSFFKTASLIALSCEASSLLANCPKEVTESCFLFGKHLGLAYQV
jgi:all-trans-nonaprenyl-diphosphate synthase